MPAYQRVVAAGESGGHEVGQSDQTVTVRVAALGGHVITFDFCKNVLEWYATLHDEQGRELFRYWDDLWSANGESREELEQLLASAAIRWIHALAGRELRVGQHPDLRFLFWKVPGPRKLEVQTDSGWVDAESLLYPEGAFEQELADLRAAAG